jgi:glycerophosphoryl diester phosphodiesterase
MVAMQRFALALVAVVASACSSPPPREAAQPEPVVVTAAAVPIVIAHRGASGYRPEHTLAAYELAIEQGADFIEPDLVPTADGVLIARHENELSGSTDVASRPEFAGRRTTKRIDGVEVSGWFSEDFTLAEIRTLRAREPLPDLRPRSAESDGESLVPTFDEVIALAAAHGVGIYPETKHPTYFRLEGRRLDGTPIGIDTSQALVERLVANGFTDPKRVFIQSFEIANLLDLSRRIMPAAGVELPLVQLIGNADPVTARADDGFSQPYDVVFHARRGDDLGAIYGELDQIAGGLDDAAGWSALVDPGPLSWMARNYAAGIGPWKANLLPRVALDPAPEVEGRRFGARLTGAVHPMLANARVVGLQVHPYTVRAEDRYLALDADGTPMDAQAEVLRLFALGATGVFIDQPDIGVAAKRAFVAGD